VEEGWHQGGGGRMPAGAPRTGQLGQPRGRGLRTGGIGDRAREWVSVAAPGSTAGGGGHVSRSPGRDEMRRRPVADEKLGPMAARA
jgi:hypothetical protein